MTETNCAADNRLDPREQLFRIPSQHDGLHLLLRHLPPPAQAAGPPRAVLYVHGATFPSALSVAHRFDGRSWRDALADAGFHVWAFDCLGYGGSGRYPAMRMAADRNAPPGRASDAAQQIERVARFITERCGVASVHVVAHSWGTIAAGLFATLQPQLVERLVLFGPITQRHGPGDPVTLAAWALVTVEAQWRRFVEDVPPGHPPVLSRRHFAAWAALYLANDPDSGTRTPPSVAIPGGPRADIQDAWHGRLAYDPGRIQAPACIIRGEWDSLTTDADARWLFDALTAAPLKRDIKIGRATHLLHLEEGRHALYRETETFLLGGERG
ncbi:alpha/beta fold hydrolase [Limobrevibacterium gyesilva]|uniref:Alpha/beta hydrolase n=1 Tax=Limobrevibacterium gyesilva TaxID=2991712 RepID=A0AA41YQV2_9PROT|nr:alpha/beta hydrolase [Limobrevibacterium gyesilva]MCW3476902.1 alpha/beta hydrolase [Limobrevibacterium gyesilva]